MRSGRRTKNNRDVVTSLTSRRGSGYRDCDWESRDDQRGVEPPLVESDESKEQIKRGTSKEGRGNDFNECVDS